MKFTASVLLLLFIVFAPFPGHSQDSIGSKHPKIEWAFNSSKTSAGVFTISFKGVIEEGWGLFSITMPDDQPNSRILLDSGSTVIIKSVTEKSNRIEEKNNLLEINIRYFKKEVGIEAIVGVKDIDKGIRGRIIYMAFKGDEFTNPTEIPFRFDADDKGNLTYQSPFLKESASASQLLKRKAIDLSNPVNNCGGTGAEGSKSLWRIFILGILGGMLALIMPCTFPMIPMTVAFFTKKAVSRKQGIKNAFLYGFFIFLIYVLISVPFYFLGTGNEGILNNISTNAWLNIFFAVVFLLFALSFFGLFEISLPGNVANKADSKSGLGTFGGIFFMALTLVIVSFSCTGPILGTLLVGALNENGGPFQLTVALAGFGLALGLPFALFALFPGWLSSLPKSGSWMNTVKIVFAFIELALFIKFISNADLVMHWGLLKREVFIGIWILIGLATTLFLFGVLKFKHDPPPAKLSKGRIVAGLFFALFTAYLIPGITNTKYANLSLVSGMPPPLNYSIYGHESAKGKGVEADVINDYNKALQLAKEKNKPILIDFTGWACVNCRKMEENVWPSPEVKNLITENFILVSLYVDDRQKLKEEDQFLYLLSDSTRAEIKTIGDKFRTMQVENFKNFSQPLYAIIDPAEKLLNLPVGYTPSITQYAAWLQCGLDAFKRADK